MSTTLDIDWVHLEMLRFDMGSDARLGHADDDEGPIRGVTVGSMSISASPISMATFGAFVADTGFITTAENEGTGFIRTAEGERILEPGLTWRNPHGDTPSDALAATTSVTQVSWSDAQAFCRWSETRLPTEAEWERAARHGVASMGERAELEWVADYYDAAFFRHEQRVNPQGPTAGTARVCRGAGSLSARTPFLPDMSSDDLTFRVICPNR